MHTNFQSGIRRCCIVWLESILGLVDGSLVRVVSASFATILGISEYAGGASVGFKTSGPLLTKGLEYLQFMKEDADKLAAGDLNELMRCWENVHRMWQAESHLRTVLFREETRWPGYYFRTDYPAMNEEWEVFANCRWDPDKDEWEMIKRDLL